MTFPPPSPLQAPVPAVRGPLEPGDGSAAGRLDRITLVGLEAHGRHGVLASERETGQVFGVDVVLGLDTRPAAASDDLADTVDYGALAQDVLAVVTGEPVDLLETLAQRIADVCLDDPRVQWTEVTVHKPDAPIDATFSDVTLTIHRSR